MDTSSFDFVNHLFGITLIFNVCGLFGLSERLAFETKGWRKVIATVFSFLVLWNSLEIFLWHSHDLKIAAFVAMFFCAVAFFLHGFNKKIIELVLSACTHPVLIVLINVPVFIFGLENGFITTVALCLAIFLIPFLGGLLLMRLFRRKWLAFAGLILAYGLIIHVDVVGEALLALFVGYSFANLNRGSQTRHRLVEMVLFSAVLVTIYVYLDHITMIGQFYDSGPRPDILFLLTCPFFLVQGFLLNRVLNGQIKPEAAIADPSDMVDDETENTWQRIVSYTINLVACIVFSVISQYIIKLQILPPALISPTYSQMPVDTLMPPFLNPVYFVSVMLLWILAMMALFELGRRYTFQSSDANASNTRDTPWIAIEDILATSFDVPLAFSDLLDLLNPLRWIKSIYVSAKALHELVGKLFFLSPFKSETFASNWRGISVLCLSIILVLKLNGVSYYPDWLADIGINTPLSKLGVIGAGLATAYVAGSLLRLRHRSLQ